MSNLVMLRQDAVHNYAEFMQFFAVEKKRGHDTPSKMNIKT